MRRFFLIFAWICAFSLSASFGGAYLSGFPHLIVGLSAAILTTALHCLVFGIFTGAGKDTREVVQDLKLDPQLVARVKAHRKVVFPVALYAILLLAFTSCLGGAASSSGHFLYRWVHLVVAFFTLAYNFRAFRIEYRAVAENSFLLNRVNEAASRTLLERPSELKEIPELAGFIPAATETMEWGAHVYALGKFLCFLGYNVWLIFFYLRFIVGYFTLSVWPFLAMSLVFLLGGAWLRRSYSGYRPSNLTV